MQKWEYLSMYVYGDQVVAINLEETTRKDARGRSYRPGYLTVLNELGEQGWELATLHPSPRSDSFTAIFKRPKP
jgi:hypothetical protein